MANQTRQLAEVLRGEGAAVELAGQRAVPARLGGAAQKGVRAFFRLVPICCVCGGRGASRPDARDGEPGWSWHLFAAPAVWIGWLRGVPVVVNYRGGEAEPFLARSAASVRATLRRRPSLVLPSASCSRCSRATAWRGASSPTSSIRTLPSPRGATAIRRWSASDRGAKPRGHLRQRYGASCFALLSESWPGARSSIAGSGPEAAALAAFAQELGVADRVRFTGRLDRDQMAALYRDADLMLNASRVDNMPNALLEALASGLAVVTSDVGGIPSSSGNARRRCWFRLMIRRRWPSRSA